MKIIVLTLAALGSVITLPAQASPTQNADMSAKQVSAMMRFAMPTLLESAYTKCSRSFVAGGYMATNRSRLMNKFTDGSAAYWPVAKGAISSFAGPDNAQLFQAMPDQALKPFVLAMVSQTVSQEMKVENCPLIEDIMEQLDPMPADNVAELAGIAFDAFRKEEAN